MGDWFTQNAPATGAKPAGDWFAQNAPQAPKPEVNHVKDALHALWEWTGKPALALAGPAIPGLNGPGSSEKSLGTLKSMIEGLTKEGPRILDQIDKAGTELFQKGNFERFAHHVAGAAPVVGAPVQQIGSEVEQGEYGKAGGHTAALFAPFLADTPVPRGVSDAVDATATATGGAIKGAAQSAVTSSSLTRMSPVEAVSASLGGYLAKELGLPGHVAGALAGKLVPQIIKGGYRGAKTALAQRAATKAATANDAALAADASKIPPDVMAELTRESGIPEPPVPQEAPIAVPQGQPIPGAPATWEGAAQLDRLRADQASRAATGPVPVRPQALLGAGPQNVIQMEAAPDGSFVRGVPGEYPAVEPKTIAQQIQEHVAAKSDPQPMIGAHKVTRVEPSGGERPALRPPLKSATPVVESATQVDPVLEQPRSTFTASGETKSPQLRGAEIKGANTTAKAQRFAEQMHAKGVTSQDAADMQAGRVSDAQIGQGVPPRWGNLADYIGENEPRSSVPEIIAELRKLEAAKAKAAPIEQPATKVKSPRDMTRAELAKQAGLPADATTEQIMKALADAMAEEQPKAAAAAKGKQ